MRDIGCLARPLKRILPLFERFFRRVACEL